MEAQLITNQLNSQTLQSYSNADIQDQLISIFQEIKMLTGAILHSGEDLLLQVKVLSKFIMSHPQFTGLTTNEIRHAFYLNCQGEYDHVYRHYNKELNAEFIGDVLLAYLKYKNIVQKRIIGTVKAIIDPSEGKPIVMPTEQEIRDCIQQDYEILKKGTIDLIFFAWSKYKLLRRYRVVSIQSREYWWKLYYYAMEQREMYGRRPLSRLDEWEREKVVEVAKIYKAYRDHGHIPFTEHLTIVNLIRKNLYLTFLKEMAAQGINDIFNEILFYEE